LETVEGRSFPKGIQDAIAAAVCDVQMGLFPEISRSWIAVDNRLFLWNYYRNDYNVFAELDQLIISVGLVKPKISAFAPNPPDYVLVITTLIEVVLVRVDLSNSLYSNSLELRHSKITAPTDGIPMRAVKGTDDGRVFLAGNDGTLYELEYEAPSLLHTLGVKRQVGLWFICWHATSKKNALTLFLNACANSASRWADRDMPLQTPWDGLCRRLSSLLCRPFVFSSSSFPLRKKICIVPKTN